LVKFGGLIPESTHDTTAVAFPTKPLPKMFYFNDVFHNWNRDCYSNGESWTIWLLLQPSVSGDTVSLLV